MINAQRGVTRLGHIAPLHKSKLYIDRTYPIKKRSVNDDRFSKKKLASLPVIRFLDTLIVHFNYIGRQVIADVSTNL